MTIPDKIGGRPSPKDSANIKPPMLGPTKISVIAKRSAVITMFDFSINVLFYFYKYTMIEVILALIGGIAVGYLFRRKQFITTISRLSFPIVLLLLFSIGISIGLNDTLLENFHSLSFDALIITGFALAGTIACSFILWRTVLKRKDEEQK